MPLTGSASVRAKEHSLLPRLHPSEVPWAADWDKLPCLKDWNTTSKHHVDQRWKQQAFLAGSSFRPFSLFSFHFESDNASWAQPFICLHSSRHRWYGACISLSAGSGGVGFPGLSSQASLMEKIYHSEHGRAWLMELARQSRGSPAPGTERGANLQRAAQQLSTSVNLEHAVLRALPENQTRDSRLHMKTD